MAGKGVRAGGTMNVCIAVLLCFALLGALVWSGSAVAGGPVVLLDDVGPVCTGTVRNAA